VPWTFVVLFYISFFFFFAAFINEWVHSGRYDIYSFTTSLSFRDINCSESVSRCGFFLKILYLLNNKSELATFLVTTMLKVFAILIDRGEACRQRYSNIIDARHPPDSVGHFYRQFTGQIISTANRLKAIQPLHVDSLSGVHSGAGSLGILHPALSMIHYSMCSFFFSIFFFRQQ
jgi:hypothetical protein